MGAILLVGLPQGALRASNEASQPFTSWENLLEGPPGKSVKLRGRILSSLAPSHAGFAAYHKLEAHEDDEGHTEWEVVLADVPEFLLELSRDGPSARVEAGYPFEHPYTKDIGAYRYDYLPLDADVWLLGTLTGYDEVPLESERVDASAGAGPAQRIPRVKATFVAACSVEDYVSSKRWTAGLCVLPGLALLIFSALMLRLALKRSL
ncbi:MAG: hypothetical protein KIS92_01670 [Planctomycetota bacterium]|nr:hypothetical protein [Planctomycetota bacterium]